jgi:hypothetical protein
MGLGLFLWLLMVLGRWRKEGVWILTPEGKKVF